MNRATSDRRLLKLAEFLEALPEGRFYYGDWVGPDWAGKQDLSCGTTACALGWAATMPTFRRLGLRLVKNDGYYNHGTVVNFRTGSDNPMDAGAEVFGISDDEAAYLFEPGAVLYDEMGEAVTDMYVAPPKSASARLVASHIRAFVKWRTTRSKEAAA